jgi:hypothetical protein
MLKTILTGVNNELDAQYIYMKLCGELKDQFDSDLSMSLISNHTYNEKTIPFHDFIHNLNIFMETSKKYDVDNQVKQFKNRTNDIVQLKSVKKIIDEKPRVVKLSEVVMNNTKFTGVRKCPHCYRKVEQNGDDDYSVCGFLPHKKNNDGCGRDFCYRCGKKLCKRWQNDQLWVEQKRYHDSSCCKKYAEKTGDGIYPDDYCQCYNTKGVK